MKPQLGDTVIGRYTLVSSLRESDGLSAWIANDRMLAQSCQLFIITDTSVLPQINEAASTLALANSRYCTPVLQLQHVGDAAVVITEPDSGLALAEYMQRSSSSFLSYDAIRSIVGQCTQAVQELLDTGLTHTALSTDTIRVSVNGVQFADTPVAAALADICSGIDGDVMSYEQMATRQLAALLYALLTKTPSGANTMFDLNMLPADVPTEFRVICKRGLALHTEDGEIIVPMATLAELSALLGAWEPFGNLSDRDIILPSVSGSASISMVALRDTSDDKIVELPDGLVTSTKLPELSISEAGLAAGAEARFVNEQRLAQQAFLAQLPGDPPSADQPVIPEAELFEPDTAEPSKTLASLQSKVGQLMGSLRKDGEPESPVTTSTAEETAIEQPMPVYAPLPASFPPAAKPRRSATGATQAQSGNGVNVPANAAGASGVAGGTGKPRTTGATGEIQSIVANMPNVPLPEEDDNERTRAGSIPPLPQSGEAQVSEGEQTVAGSHPTTRAAQPIATNAMPQPRAHMSESLAALAARSAKAAASGDAVMPPSFAVSASAPGANGAAIPGSSKSRTRMTAPISRDALRNMSGGRPAAAPGANVPGVQTPAQRAQSDAFDPTVTVPLLGTDGTSVDQLPPMAQIMPPSFAPQQVHDVNAANVGRNIEEDLPDQPLWGQLKIKVIAIVVALVLLVVGLVAAWFILNGDNHGGGQLKQAGINIDLAPVLGTVQVKRSSNAPIGALNRDFGLDSNGNAQHGIAFVEGMRDAGVGATVKHYPGLGAVTGNTDFTTEGILDTTTTLDDEEIGAFNTTIKQAKPAMVMMSLATYQRIDSSAPAAFSSKIIDGTLRGSVGYDGVVISDSLSAAAVSGIATKDLGVRLVDAGGDLACIGDTSYVTPILDGIIARAQSDPAFAKKVTASATRVMTLKYQMGLAK